MTDRRYISSRLENWARVYRDTHRLGISPTGAFCDQLRRDAMGEAASPERRKLDEVDAQSIEAGMVHLTTRHRLLLWWCYIKQAHPGEVCRSMGIAHRPVTVFVQAFRDAEAAIERIVDERNIAQNS